MRMLETQERSIDILQEHLKDQDANLYNAKKDLKAAQVALEVKEKLLKAMQDASSKVDDEAVDSTQVCG